jgi:Flp pilus assembly protein TadD
LAEAEDGYRQVIAGDKQHADALHLLGVVCLRKGHLQEGESLIRRALALREEASFLNNLGSLLLQTERLPAAEAAYRRALQLKPDHADAHNNLASLLEETGRLLEAEAGYRRALELKPDYASAHNNLGVLLAKLGRLPEAEIAYRRALELRPDYADAYNNHGNLFLQTNRLLEAEAAYRRAIELRPDYANAHNNLGNLLLRTNRLPEAEAVYRRALALKPNYANAHANLGVLLSTLRRLPEAEAAYRRALELKPDHIDAHNNLGHVLRETRRLPAAEAAYRRALELKPDFADARWNLGLLLLALGRYAEAWPCYESRYDPSRKEVVTEIPDLPYPQWRGEPLLGKSLVILPEQGFGDEIQFARYVPLLKMLGAARVTLVCPCSLNTLLSTVAGADAVTNVGQPLPTHDYWAFALSLPLHVGTTLANIPGTLPYLHAPPDLLAQWGEQLPTRGLKVGLVWKGSPALKNDASRSLPGLAALAPLWAVPGITFVSLQKGQGEEEARNAPPGQPLLHLGANIRDFADTAAIVAQLDLVICVDTAIAHLAGALGRPCWVLLPIYGTDWRWLLDRVDSPWYPSVMRLFRQSRLDDWPETICEVAAALKTWGLASATKVEPAPVPLSALGTPQLAQRR